MSLSLLIDTTIPHDNIKGFWQNRAQLAARISLLKRVKRQIRTTFSFSPAILHSFKSTE